MMDLGRAYNNFTGQIRCNICKTLSTIEVQEGVLKSVKHASGGDCTDETRGSK
ncbi:MAG: hypothetical protein AAGU11_00725 [Syntrophobacteraceae bacterium]